MEPEKHQRYRLPEHVKERQATDLRKRFAAYSGGKPTTAPLRVLAAATPVSRRAARVVLRVLLVAVLAYAVWRYWR